MIRHWFPWVVLPREVETGKVSALTRSWQVLPGAYETIQGLQSAGVQACAKHYLKLDFGLGYRRR